MKVINTFDTAEIPNPHFISVRALLVNEGAQFEHLMLEPGQEQHHCPPVCFGGNGSPGSRE